MIKINSIETRTFIYICCYLLQILIKVQNTTLPFHNENQRKFMNKVKAYEVNDPIRVTRNGDFITNKIQYTLSKEEIFNSDEFLIQNSEYIPHLHPSRSYYHNGKPFYELYPVDDPTVVHYKIKLDGKLYHLDMSLNRALVGPSLIIESFVPYQNASTNAKPIVSKTIRDEHGTDRCHFLGKVRGYSNSKVALGTCNGLLGFIDLGIGDNLYYIEPMKENVTNNVDNNNDSLFFDSEPKNSNHLRRKRTFNVEVVNHPHLIYKRSAITKKQDYSANENVKENIDYMESKKNIYFKKKRNVINNNGSSKKENNKRKKRSFSKLKTIEAMLTVDSTFLKYHSNTDISNYLLTIMNMVAAIYHEASLGQAIDITVVKIYKLYKYEPNLAISNQVDTLLTSFCKWSNALNPSDESNPEHFDNAIFITRLDLCSSNCNTVGYAHIAGMCLHERSCNVNEDNGLNLAGTIAHEMGHNFGSTHDQNECYPKIGENFLMSPLASTEPGPMIWSECSRNAIKAFLLDNYAECLEDMPAYSLHKFPDELPGALFSIDQQCMFQFGTESCSFNKNICEKLWCKADSGCKSSSPAATGSKCGTKKICFNGKCISKNKMPKIVNGAWGQWGKYSECSRTCGGGVSVTERLCNNPSPQNGGKFCIGKERKYEICNYASCLKESISFHAQQCQNYRKPFNGYIYNWKVYELAGKICKLICIQNNIYSELGILADGSSCGKNTNDMCINGKCTKVGCDWKFNSEIKTDKCGVCQGDGNTCVTKKESFTAQGQGYIQMFKIPRGSRNIMIKEKKGDKNYIAIHGKKNYLNMNLLLNYAPSNIPIAGSVIEYTRINDQDVVKIERPIDEELTIELFMQEKNNGVSLEYIKKKKSGNSLESHSNYIWKHDEETLSCNVTCGGGFKTHKVICVNNKKNAGGGSEIDDGYCTDPKPHDKIVECNNDPCEANWVVSEWQECSVTCGQGGSQSRLVTCAEKHNEIQNNFEDEICEKTPKPDTTRDCPYVNSCQDIPPTMEPTHHTEEPFGPNDHIIKIGNSFVEIDDGSEKIIKEVNISPAEKLNNQP